jgi:hypothetical protein
MIIRVYVCFQPPIPATHICGDQLIKGKHLLGLTVLQVSEYDWLALQLLGL